MNLLLHQSVRDEVNALKVKSTDKERPLQFKVAFPLAGVIERLAGLPVHAVHVAVRHYTEVGTGGPGPTLVGWALRDVSVH